MVLYIDHDTIYMRRTGRETMPPWLRGRRDPMAVPFFLLSIFLETAPLRSMPTGERRGPVPMWGRRRPAACSESVAKNRATGREMSGREEAPPPAAAAVASTPTPQATTSGASPRSGTLLAVCHNYIGHKYIGHNYRGHNYIGHNYIGHNYRGHNYIGP